jgi:hypothetical protein
MSSGAFALHIDQKAGEGSLIQIDRIVPLPRLGNHDGIHFDNRRLTIPTTICRRLLYTA